MTPQHEPDQEKPLRILLAEDHFTIAEAYSMLLREMGYEVVGPVSSVDQALRMLAAEEVDGAVLDIGLRGNAVTPVAEQLRRLGRPFVFLTGLADLDLLPKDMMDTPTIEKPAGRGELADALNSLELRRGETPGNG